MVATNHPIMPTSESRYQEEADKHNDTEPLPRRRQHMETKKRYREPERPPPPPSPPPAYGEEC